MAEILKVKCILNQMMATCKVWPIAGKYIENSFSYWKILNQTSWKLSSKHLVASPQLALLGAHYSYGKKLMIRNWNVIG